MALDHLVEGRRLDPQHLGRLPLHPAGGRERALDQLRLEGGDHVPEREPLGRHHELGHLERARGAHPVGDELGADPRAGRQHDRTLDDVLQLAHVARPVVSLHEVEGLGRQLQVRLVVLGPVLLQEVMGEQRDVFAPVAQRRQLDLDDVQPIVEVFSELPFGHELLEVDVGRRDDAGVDLLRLDPAQPHELPFLHHPQQLGLRLYRHAADLVEEDGALVGQLEQPLLGGHGAREGPLEVAEQVRFEQVRRQAAGVHGDEGVVGAGRAGMEGARRQLLAGPALAFHEDRRAAQRGLGDQLEHLAHARAAADDVPQPLLLRAQARAERAVLGHQPPLLGRVADHHHHFFVLERLGDVVERAVLHGRDRVLERRVGGDEDDRQVFVEAAQPVERLDAADARHHHVDDGDVEPPPAGQRQALVAVGGRRDVAALPLEQRLQDVPHDLLVVDDQDGCMTKHRREGPYPADRVRRCAGAGRVTVKRVPPAPVRQSMAPRCS